MPYTLLVTNSTKSKLCLDLVELISGVRLHSSCLVPGLMYRDVSSLVQIEVIVLQSYQCVINSLVLGLSSLQTRLKYVCCIILLLCVWTNTS